MMPLHVDVLGRGQPLVMLHGWGWNSAIWQPLLPLLQETYQLFLVDLPGFGKSPLLKESYHLHDVASQVLDVVPQKAIWLGWSMGGLIALWVAMRYPERISRLVTVASSPRFLSDINWPGIHSSVLEKFSMLLMTDSKKTLRDFLELQLRGSPNKDELFSQLEKKLFSSHSIALAALLGGIELLKTTDLREDLHKIECPSLHIFGQLDTIVPQSVMSRFAEWHPNGKFEMIKRTGHMPFLSHSEEFVALLNSF